MYSLLLLASLSFALSLLFTPACRGLSRLGFVDVPNPGRKRHSRPTPRVGGIAIALAYVATFAIWIVLPGRAGLMLQPYMPLVWKLLPAVGIVFVTGLLDDLLSLKPWQKLAGQLIAALLAYWAGVRIAGVAGFSASLYWSLPLTILWLLLITNGFNLIDGMDGLAAGIGHLAAVTIALLAILQNNIPLALVTVPLAGCLLGFLPYNFRSGSIFLGDSGSLLTGFLLACYGVIWSHKSTTVMALAAPMMALTLPILDVGLSVARRVLRYQPVFEADRNHIHHRLLDRGCTPRHAILLLYGVGILAGVFSLVQSTIHNWLSGFAAVLFCVMVWIGVQQLQYVEFETAFRMLRDGVFQRALRDRMVLNDFEAALDEVNDIGECWRVMREMSPQFGISNIRFSAEDRPVGTVWRHEACSPVNWELHLKIFGKEYITLAGHNERGGVPETIPAIAAILMRTLQRTSGESGDGRGDATMAMGAANR